MLDTTQETNTQLTGQITALKLDYKIINNDMWT